MGIKLGLLIIFFGIMVGIGLYCRRPRRCPREGSEEPGGPARCRQGPHPHQIMNLLSGKELLL